MTANTRGYNTPIGFYRPGLSSIDRLLQTTVGRDHLVDDLIEHLIQQRDHQKKRHVLVEGGQGAGKTHLIKILYRSIQESVELQKRYVCLAFPSDLYHVLTFTDWIIELTGLLASFDQSYRSRGGYEQLRDIDDDNELIEQAVHWLTDHCQRNNQHILVLCDRLDHLFFDGKKAKSIDSQFQRFVEQSDGIMLVGTINETTDGNDERDTFSNQYFISKKLNDLSELQAIEFIRRNLEWDRQDAFLSDFENIIPKIQALHQMTGGNPRLMMCFYEFILNENIIDIKRLFERLLDQLTPFYRSRLEALSPSERALLANIAAYRKESPTQTQLARKMRISHHSCAGNIAKVLKVGLIRVADHPTDKRSRIYRIREGFFDLWLAIGQMQDPHRFLPLVGEFLSKWYSDPLSRETKRQRLWNNLHILDRRTHRIEIENAEQLLGFLADLGDETERKQTKLELAFYQAENDKVQLARNLLQSVSVLHENEYHTQWITDQIYRRISGQSGHIQMVNEIFSVWKHLRTGDTSQTVSTALKVSDTLIKNRLDPVNIGFLKEIALHLRSDAHRLPILARIAGSMERLDEYEAAITVWQDILELAANNQDPKTAAIAHNYISQIFQDRSDYAAAMQHLDLALNIMRRIGDNDGQATALNNKATIQYSQGYYENALEFLEQALTITRWSKNTRIEAVTLSNLSLIYQTREDFGKAADLLNQSLILMREIGNIKGEATTLFNLSQVFKEQLDYETADAYMIDALRLWQEMADRREICKAYLQLGDIRWHRQMSDSARECWTEAYQIASENDYDDLVAKIKGLLQTFQS